MSKAVVFDMDGVLFDTERLCMEGWKQIAKERGIEGMEEVGRDSIGRNQNDTRALVLARYGEDFDFEDFRSAVSTWCHAQVDAHGLPVKPGVRELLDFLREQGYHIGLASSSREASVRRNLRLGGIEDYFEAVISGDMVEHSKPEPDIFLLACERLQAEPATTYAIEDSPNGIRAAAAAGMLPIMVPDLIAPDEEMERLCLRIEKDLLQVKEFLAQAG